MSNKSLEDLIRTSPDPLARNTLPKPIYLICSSFSHSIFILSLPLTLSYFALKHFLLGPQTPDMQLKATLITRELKLYLNWVIVWYLPAVDKGEWKIPSPITSGVKAARSGIQTDFVELQPVEDELRVGVARVPAVEAVKRPSWMLSPPGALGGGLEHAHDGEKVILYLPGGAYVMGHPLSGSGLYDVSRKLTVRALGVNYRKTVHASNAHPAPLLDALSAYIYLTTVLSFTPSLIILMGDSAGGHLALLLSRYLHDLSLPQTGYLILTSPRSDFTYSHPSIQSNAGSDYLPPTGLLGLRSGLRHYIYDEVVKGVHFSPALGRPEDFSYLRDGSEKDVLTIEEVRRRVRGVKEGRDLHGEGRPTKVYIQVGTGETMLDEINSLSRLMKGAALDLQMREDPDGLHCGALTRFPGSTAWETYIKDVENICRD